MGNCAYSQVQGVHYYRNTSESQFVPGPGLYFIELSLIQYSDNEARRLAEEFTGTDRQA